jgi:predicted phosphodiesterase
VNKEKLLRVLSKKGARYKFKELLERTRLNTKELNDAIASLREDRPDLTFGKYDKTYWLADRPTWYSNQTDLSKVMPTKGKFGFVTDTHLCSIAERLDVLNDAYDDFARQGITTVFHAGDFTDGWHEYRHHINFTKCHGDQAQAAYLMKHYPKREGITTYGIGGNHDDSYASSKVDRMSLVVNGFHHEGKHYKGRDDIVYLGQYSHYIILPQEIRIHLLHPRGGASYAISYKQQKRSEEMDRNARPDIQLSGHYHVFSYIYLKGTHFVAGIGMQDETEFFKRLGFGRSIGYVTCEYEIVKGELRTFTVTPRFYPD